MMTKEMRTRLKVYGIIVIIVGILGMAWWHYIRVEKAYADARLISSLDQVILCANTLRLVDEGRLDTARSLLDRHLDSSLQSALDMHDAGGHLHVVAAPNMKEGVRRAAQYLRSRGNTKLVVKAEKLMRVFEEK